ncbi:ArsC family (seleno)protein [Gemmata sp.]|uniref:ArsC family (seleno)protein n=1 Tax=Gemmata sp. TaxID=1914242 RepID=UPI003F6FCD85
MQKKIDWLYHRKSCVTCQRAEAHRDGAGVAVTETVDARKVRFTEAEALKLLDGVETLVAMKGPKVVRFDLKKDRPADEELLKHLMGPTGNLRAPAARVGRTLLIGFNDEAYTAALG